VLGENRLVRSPIVNQGIAVERSGEVMARLDQGVMLLRAVIAFMLLPGVVAVFIPALLIRGAQMGGATAILGIAILLLGLLLLLWCVRDFYVVGRGTVAPWSPPKNLVTVGLYRYSRNPMYVAVLLMLLGWAVTFGGSVMWIYTAIVALAFHLRVVIAEEPYLARNHGDSWAAYRSRVRRWV
jgi:protein-S-isoprenylcysteine O-methyltransferase Ste14